MTPREAFDALYYECIPQRISPTPDLSSGPTEQFRRLELERQRWLAVREVGVEQEEGAA